MELKVLKEKSAKGGTYSVLVLSVEGYKDIKVSFDTSVICDVADITFRKLDAMKVGDCIVVAKLVK